MTNDEDKICFNCYYWGGMDDIDNRKFQKERKHMRSGRCWFYPTRSEHPGTIAHPIREWDGYCGKFEKQP